MANNRVEIDFTKLERELFRGANRSVTLNAIEKTVEKKAEKAQQGLIKDFETHPITRELDNGLNSSNVSSTLGGIGNLYSFIGFGRGSKPTQAIRNNLKEKISIRAKHTGGARVSVEVMGPEEEKIYRATPIPWSPGLSWAKRMEIGISGLGSFIAKRTDKSRSGGGVQVKQSVRAAGFRPRPYLSVMFKKFYKTITK